MKKKTLLILIEVANRELDAKLLLSLKAIKSNFRVIIGQKGNVWSILDKIKPSIILLKSFGPRNTKVIDFLKKKNFKIFSNDEELILAWDMSERVNYRFNNENTHKIDKLIAVGNYDYEEVKKLFKFSSDKLIKVGNLRLELLKKNYKKIFEKDKIYIKKKYGNFIFFATNFVRINTRLKFDHQIDFVYHRIVDDKIDPESHHISLINDQIIMQREILIQTLKFLDNFEKNSNGKKIILSPHPNENKKFWLNLFEKRSYKNIILNDSEDIPSTTFMDASDLVISSNSTSLLESYFLNKKIINFLSSESRLIEIKFLKEISNVVRSSSELEQILKDFENIKFFKKNNEMSSVVKNFDESFNSFDYLIRMFDDIKIDAVNNPFINRKSQVFLYLLNLSRTLKGYIKKFLKYEKQTFYHKLHKQKIGDKMSRFKFINKIKIINEVENIPNLKVKQIIPQVFLIDK